MKVQNIIGEDTEKILREFGLDTTPVVEATEEKKQKEEKPLATTLPVSSTSNITNDYIILKDLICVDADGNIFEQYPVLYVKKDVERNGASYISFTPYKAASDFEKQGSFLASMALTCNIMNALYPHRSDADVKRFLLQYKDHGAGYGLHVQNTVINYGTPEIIHYPTAADFNQAVAVNAGQKRKAGNFAKATLQDCLLEDALKDAAPTRYVKQFTGLVTPEVLVEVGKYFGKPAQLWFPWNGQAGTAFTDKRAAWLGCSSDVFYLITYNYLNYFNAARGVRRSAP